MKNMGYFALNLTDDAIERLRLEFPPKYERLACHHVSGDQELPANRHSVEIVGYADDSLGVEAFVVMVDGSTERPDGGVYHITYSLAEDEKQSNPMR